MKNWFIAIALVIVVVCLYVLTIPKRQSSSQAASVPSSAKPSAPDNSNGGSDRDERLDQLARARTAGPATRQTASADAPARPGRHQGRLFPDLERERAAQRELVQSHSTGEIFENGSERFTRLRLGAVRKSEYRPEMGAPVSERMGFVFVAGEHGLPVVANENGLLGIVTGTIIVKLRDFTLAEQVSRDHRLTVKFLDPDLQTVYFSNGSATTTTLTQATAALRADASVEEVRLEIVQGHKGF